MFRCLAAAVFALGPLTYAAALAQRPAAWHGEYIYEHDAGGGRVVEYRVRLGEDGCQISAQGFQTDEVIRCRAVGRAGTPIDIDFASYGDGGVSNVHGVQLYQPGERLFSLSDRRGVIWTGWGAYSPFENGRPLARHFRRVS